MGHSGHVQDVFCNSGIVGWEGYQNRIQAPCSETLGMCLGCWIVGLEGQ